MLVPGRKLTFSNFAEDEEDDEDKDDEEDDDDQRWVSAIELGLGGGGSKLLHRMRGVRSEMGRQMPDIYEADLPGRAS